MQPAQPAQPAGTGTVPVTIADLVERTIAAHTALAGTGEVIEEELQYIADLTVVWHGRLRAVAETRGGEPAPAPLVAAVDAVVAETARIDDPHVAIDWLSTLPQVVLLALGEGA